MLALPSPLDCARYTTGLSVWLFDRNGKLPQGVTPHPRSLSHWWEQKVVPQSSPGLILIAV